MVTALSSASITATGATTTRTLSARWSDIVNVKDYGATGNGTTDDSASIQAAFYAAFGAWAAPNGTPNKTANRLVFFPAGNYNCGNPLFLRSVTSGWIYGAGAEATKLTYSGNIPPTTVFTVTNANPAVFSMVNHGYTAGDVLCFVNAIVFAGGLPYGLATWTPYTVLAAGLTANTFEVSGPASSGAAIDTSAGGRSFTVDIAVSCTITMANHGLTAGAPLKFYSTGALPANLFQGATYYVLAASLTANTFKVSFVDGGTPVDTSGGSQSGTHVIGPIFTVTIASPAVFSLTSHGLTADTPVAFNTTGALPTGLTAGTLYYVISAGLTANQFEVSTTVGGSAVNTSGSQSGIHTIVQFGEQDIITSLLTTNGYSYSRMEGIAFDISGSNTICLNITWNTSGTVSLNANRFIDLNLYNSTTGIAIGFGGQMGSEMSAWNCTFNNHSHAGWKAVNGNALADNVFNCTFNNCTSQQTAGLNLPIGGAVMGSPGSTPCIYGCTFNRSPGADCYNGFGDAWAIINCTSNSTASTNTSFGPTFGIWGAPIYVANLKWNHPNSSDAFITWGITGGIFDSCTFNGGVFPSTATPPAGLGQEHNPLCLRGSLFTGSATAPSTASYANLAENF